MIKRRTIGLAAATAIIGGLGAYGATGAFAATEPAPKPITTQISDPDGRADSGGGKEAMIRHCTDQMPAGDRAAARQQMEKMMSDGMMSKDMKGMMPGGAMGSMMGGASQDGPHGRG
ncbi:hypothetical protein [Streptomyces halobius]|uniref:Pentapeptide MXKDX repeat protein n=1 Tax=Streptomyces halobius TaxID=2879846 RepID=A0ABY4M0U2_9ACTN|nr:hypothetical protein [Streptomyces halobius]UQA91072.1 hypothetical protein K9S39_03515 [Streptomyces halobius]